MFDQFDRPMLPINDWDNHEIHIFTHEKFMKSQAFEMLDPVVQEQFVKHVEAHKAKMQEKMLTELMQGGTTGGIPQLEGMPGQEGQQQQGGNPDGANQFSGIEQPVDPAQG